MLLMPTPEDFKHKPTEATKDDPTVRASRLAMKRPDDGEAFLPDPAHRGAHITANDAESFGEEFVASATAGEPVQMEALDEVADDEEGGPFLELDANEEIPEPLEDREDRSWRIQTRNLRRPLPR
jgi:hypothetical protein